MDAVRSPVGTNKALARRETAELWSRGELEFVDEAYAETVTLRTAGDGPRVLDRAALKAQYGEWRTGFPDLSVTILESAADRDLVMQHVVLRGTHEGEFRGVAPTGRTIAVDGFTMRRFRDGQVVATVSLVDEATLAAQLGLDVPLRP